MATDPKAADGGKSGRQPSSLLERILRSANGAEMVGAMIRAGINIPNEAHNGSPIRLQLMRGVKTPLDDEQRNLIAIFVTQWLDTSDPTKDKVKNEAQNATAVRPVVLQLIQDLNGANTEGATRAKASSKRTEVERRLRELIGLKPGRPDSDPNPVLNTIMGQGASGNGNDLISAMLVLNELSENTPLPIRIGPRRTETIDVRREWAEDFGKKVLIGVAIATTVIALWIGVKLHWGISIVAVIVVLAGFVWLLKQAADAGGRFFRRVFPQFDEDGFRQKTIKQAETTRRFLTYGTEEVTKEEIVQWGLAPLFLEEVDGELRKEGFVYNRFDEQIDDWVKDYLGLAPATPKKSKTSSVERFFRFLNKHGW